MSGREDCRSCAFSMRREESSCSIFSSCAFQRALTAGNFITSLLQKNGKFLHLLFMGCLQRGVRLGIVIFLLPALPPLVLRAGERGQTPQAESHAVRCHSTPPRSVLHHLRRAARLLCSRQGIFPYSAPPRRRRHRRFRKYSEMLSVCRPHENQSAVFLIGKAVFCSSYPPRGCAAY